MSRSDAGNFNVVPYSEINTLIWVCSTLFHRNLLRYCKKFYILTDSKHTLTNIKTGADRRTSGWCACANQIQVDESRLPPLQVLVFDLVQ